MALTKRLRCDNDLAEWEKKKEGNEFFRRWRYRCHAYIAHAEVKRQPNAVRYCNECLSLSRSRAFAGSRQLWITWHEHNRRLSPSIKFVRRICIRLALSWGLIEVDPDVKCHEYKYESNPMTNPSGNKRPFDHMGHSHHHHQIASHFDDGIFSAD